jgi:hypothetical protein
MRRTASGRTTTVRRHSRNDDGLTEQEQAKRDRLEQRVLRERRAARREQQFGTKPGRAPGEKRRRKLRGPSPKGAAKRARKAVRMMRRHKVRAVLTLGLAAAELGAWDVWRGGSKAWKAGARGVRRLRRRKARRRS